MKVGDRVIAIEETSWVKKGATGIVISEGAMSDLIRWDNVEMLNRKVDDQSWWIRKGQIILIKTSLLKRILNFFKKK